MKLPPEDLNPNHCPHTPQAFIFVERPLHQGCAVVAAIQLTLTINCNNSKKLSTEPTEIVENNNT